MIELIAGYAIKVDPLNYTLAFNTGKTNKNGEVVYRALGYYSTLRSAIKACIRYLIREQLSKDTYTLEEAIKIIDKNTKLIDELLNKRFGSIDL